MAEISNELIYEVLKSVQFRLAQVDGKADENKSDMMALRTQITSIHHDLLSIHHELGGVHATLIRHEQRLDRIERRLELSDAPAT
jgi:septal ring factor EnvC (AmiA/AmiB activator)